uniref:GATA zinc finger domain-containing protein 1 n=1 Tax=Timema douglasi TaxID=61478 RepID=A0A7R8ZEW2_TIMDO|nr:unnamed protein product [Timema douglasi]
MLRWIPLVPVSAINVNQSAHPAPAPVISSFRKGCKLMNKQEDVDMEMGKKKEAEENAIKITQDSRPKPIPLPSPSTDLTPLEIKVVSRRKAPPRRSKRLKHSTLATPKELNPTERGQRVVEVEKKTVEFLMDQEHGVRTTDLRIRKIGKVELEEVNPHLRGGRVENHLEKPPPIHPTEIRISISPSSAFELHNKRGTYFQVGDIVSMVGQDNRTYYAQLRGFLTDQYCDKSTVITWIVPTHASPPPTWGFDPDTYVFEHSNSLYVCRRSPISVFETRKPSTGKYSSPMASLVLTDSSQLTSDRQNLAYDEESPRKLETMTFVMHAPNDYFKVKQSPYPPSNPQPRDYRPPWGRLATAGQR